LEIRNVGPNSGATITAEDFAAAVRDLIAKARALVDAVSLDDTGRLVAGRWVGGNGGLLSRSTLQVSDVLRTELERWK
jgi:hypothetical protein